MVSKELLGYFEQSLNAVFVSHAGKIEYCNTAAHKILPGIHTGDNDTRINQGVIKGDSPGVFSAVICEKTFNVAVLPRDDCTVYTVYEISELEESGNPGYLLPVYSALIEALSTMKISGDLVSQYFEGREDDKTAKYIAAMTHSYYKMARIVSNLSNIENLHTETKRGVEGFDIAGLCCKLCDTVSSITEDKNVKLTYIGPEQDVAYCGTASEVERMLLNLLSNSFKYTPAGGEIKVRLQKENKRLLLSVADNGYGMSAEELSCVFSRGDVDRETTDTKKGTGLGLRIVRRIAEKHKGGVFIESHEGAGTQVTISLPLRTDVPEALCTPVVKYEAYGMGTILTELSEILSYKAYMPEFTD